MKEYNKLIRDKIPEIIEEAGRNYEVEVLEDEEYLLSLNNKLQEELEEYLEDGDILELADMLEVIYAILDERDISRESLEDKRQKKKEKRGGFSKKYFLKKAETGEERNEQDLNSVCDWCEQKTCRTQEDEYPKWCPHNDGDWLAEAKNEYLKQENQKLYHIAAHIETTGYCEWPRIKEIAEFALSAGYKKIGLAFCVGLKDEAKIVADYYKNRGLEVKSAVCCCGSINKEELGVVAEDRFDPEGFEAGCNPIGQAKLFAECGTDFNVVLGLCVGHDSLFFKYSDAPTTVLAAKDRVLGHNPLAAVYNSDSYYSDLFSEKGES